MNFVLQNLTEIKGGLSKKKIYRKSEKNINKIYLDFSLDEKEFYNFINIYNILKKINISIPKIYEVYKKNKLIIMEDFGDDAFNKVCNEKNLYIFLKVAIDNLIIINNSVTYNDLEKLEKYSFAELKKELGEFVEYYIPHKKISNFQKDKFYKCWHNSFNDHKFIFRSFVHKDFEFINLILLDKYSNHLRCGIIDFQSALIGFSGWDLFSILENPRINFTTKYNDELIKYFFQNVNIETNYETFLLQYNLLNLARHTRLLGRWVKLFNSEKNNEYLDFINIIEKRIISNIHKIQSSELKLFYDKILKN